MEKKRSRRIILLPCYMTVIDCGSFRVYSPLSRRCILKNGARAKELKKAGYDLKRKGSCKGEPKVTLNGAKICTKRRGRRRYESSDDEDSCHENKELIEYLKRNMDTIKTAKKARILAQTKLIRKLKRDKTSLKNQVSDLKRKVGRSQNRISNLKSNINKQNRRIAMLLSSPKAYGR